MKQFACGDVVPGCKSRWVRSSEEEILAEVAAHARRDHGLTEVSDDLVAAVRDCIQNLDLGRRRKLSVGVSRQIRVAMLPQVSSRYREYRVASLPCLAGVSLRSTHAEFPATP